MLKGAAADLTALVAGALLPLAFAPFDLFPLAVIAPALLFLTWRTCAPGRAARRGFLFGVGLFGVGVSWVFVAIHDFGDTSLIPSLLLTALFVLVLALYFALLGWVAARLRADAGPYWWLGLLPGAWVAVEWLRGWFLSGFPWLSLGYSQIDTPLGGWAPVAGVYGVSFAVALGAAALAVLWARPPRWWVVPALALAVAGGGAALSGRHWTEPVDGPLRVALVQGNLPQITKWDPEAIDTRLRTYAELTLEHVQSADLIVWPENSVTVFYYQVADEYFAPLTEVLREHGTDLVAGLPVKSRDTGEYYTGMMSFGSANAVYFKHHLVPFGEFVPLQGLLRGLVGFFDMPMTGFSPGPRRQAPLTVAGEKAGVSICYEDAFGAEVIRTLPEASLLINGSNNAWYGDSMAPHQHLQISRMRALETGRPLLRATTNGITALIDARGGIRARSPQFERYVLSGAVQPMRGATPFVRWGNWPVVVLALGLVLAALLRARRAPR